MDIEKRLSNLENMVCALSNKVDRIKFYTDSDTNGNSVAISNNADEMRTEDSALEDAMCELSESTDTSIASLEQALCDLSEEIGG